MIPSRSTLALALLGGTIGCNAPTAPVEPTTLEILQRPDTVVAPGQAFDTVAIRVLDPAGRPLAGVLVEWSADGEISAFAPRTDAKGIARARWLLPGRSVDEWARPWARTGPAGAYAAAATVPGAGSINIRVSARTFTADTVSASQFYGCGLRQGELWCWGSKHPLHPSSGRDTRKVPLPSGVIARSVITANTMLCVLDQADRPHCAVPGFGERFEPIAGSPSVRDLVVSEQEMCGIALLDNSVWCWRSSHGAVHGQSAYRAQEGPYVALASGLHGFCGLSPTGSASCWGKNDRGQLGDGSTSDRSHALPVAGGHEFVAIAAGGHKACGTLANGENWCWGQVRVGEVRTVPVRLPEITGPLLDIGLADEYYLISDRRLSVRGEFGPQITTWYSPYQLRQFSVDIGGCLRDMQNAVHCSWDMFRGAITHAGAPLEPIPVPPPRNGW